MLTVDGGLAAVFAASFLAATVVPFSSEAVLYGYLKLHPEHAALAIALATLGNTAGGMTSYLIGRLFPARRRFNEKTLRTVRRYGPAATLFAWLPIVGDGLCLAAGWLRVNWFAALGFMAAGRLARYLAVGAL
ncbi:MAG: DedA family protein [Burkholderiales bacterium]|nr:DedA family protein [Burkholderiales bacterium]